MKVVSGSSSKGVEPLGPQSSVLRLPLKPNDIGWYLRSIGGGKIRQRKLKNVYGGLTAPRVPNLSQGPAPRVK